MVFNTAEGGTNGTTVTTANSGGASGDTFDLVTISDATATLIFDTTHAAHGTLGYKYQLGAVAAESYLQWLAKFSSSNETGIRVGFNGYWTANPAAAIYQFRVASAAGTASFGVKLDTAGKFAIFDTAGALVATMATAIPLNQWYHVDILAEISAGNAAVTVWRTDVLDSGQPTDRITGTVTGAVASSRIRLGHTGTGVATVGPWWIDDLQVSLLDGATVSPDTFLVGVTLLDTDTDSGDPALGFLYQPSPTQVLDVAAPAAVAGPSFISQYDGYF